MDLASYITPLMTKLAFGPVEATRVLRVVKRYSPGKAVARAMQMELGDRGPAAIPSVSNLARKHKAYDSLFQGMSNEKARRYMQLRLRDGVQNASVDKSAPVLEQAYRRGGERGLYLSAGDGPSAIYRARTTGPFAKMVKKVVSPLPDVRKMDSRNRKMLNAIIGGHELDEIVVRPTPIYDTAYGHTSPDVILREHNRVATLPAGYEPAREYMQALRRNSEARDLAEHGITYGAPGGRISRHLRKQLTDRIASSHEKKMQAVIEQQIASTPPGMKMPWE